MHTENFILGIDGGGTRTTALVATIDGHLYGESIGDSINYNSIGMQNARTNMVNVLRKLKKSTGIAHFKAVCIGSSAIFFTPTETEYKEFTNGLFNSDMVFMLGDIRIAIESMLTPPPCALAISGTGSMVAAWGEDQSIQHVGGWGYLLGDEGSAYRIALDGIKAAINFYDGMGNETTLTNEVLSYFEIQDMRCLVEKVYNSATTRSQMSAFATTVAKCAKAGDRAAFDIIVNNAHKLADCTITLLKKYDNAASIPLAVSGGVFMNNRLFYDSFVAKVRGDINGVKISQLDYPPQVGALIYCLKRMDIPITQEFLINIRNNYQAVKQGEVYG